MKNRNNPKIRKSKIGQVQLGETTAVIIIVIILIVVGAVFWSKISSSNVREVQSQSQELQVIEIANGISELTELKCSEVGVSQVKCLDWYKILAMSNAMNNSADKTTFEFYNNYFRNSKISIVKIYPEDETSNITLYDAKLNGSTRNLLIPIPIHIYNSVNKETYYGLILVEGYYNS